jgi:hypothetical protein
MIMMVVMMMMMAAGRKKSRFWLVSFPRLCPEPVSTNDLFLSFLVLSFLFQSRVSKSVEIGDFPHLGVDASEGRDCRGKDPAH